MLSSLLSVLQKRVARYADNLIFPCALCIKTERRKRAVGLVEIVFLVSLRH